MKRYAFVLLCAGALVSGNRMIADSTSTYTGTVHDRVEDQRSPATQCPVVRGPRYILQTETEALVLTNERKVAKFSGKRVTIRGKVTDGNQLAVIEIAPAR